MEVLMKISKVSIVCITLLLVIVLLTAVLPVSATPQEIVRVWVTYQTGRKAEVFQALNRADASVYYDFPELEAYVVSLPEAALNGILRNPYVIGVEGDPERYPVEPVSQVTLDGLFANTVDANGQTVPWGIDAVQARDIWDVDGNAVVDVGAPTGAGIKVCIIDTGYYAGHEDLKDNVTGMSQVDDNYLRDMVGHGSHVAGTISALNNELGVVGVSPGEVNLHIVKIFSDSGTWVTRASDLTAAIYNCRDNGAKVISMSLSGSQANKKEERAFNQVYEAGILHVAAAGNHQVESPGALHYPASYASVISVAAVDASLAVANFSAQNTPVELAAPGVGVLSTIPYIETTKVTVDGADYPVNHVEFAAYGSASGSLADGGLCTTTGNWAGKVVLCSRGDISFYDKVRNVQNSGGVAAIIYNNVPNEDLFATLGAGNSSTIIAVSTTMETGQFLLTKVGIDATVSSVYEWPVSGYEAWSGTSMATPHVAGVAALIWSANPGWTNVQIREALTETAFDLGPAGRDIAYGYGLVQAVDALAHLEGGVEPPPPPPDTQLSVEIISPEEGATVSGSVLFEVRVTAGLEAVPGAAVTLTLTGAKSAPVTLTGVTDANGTFSLTYTINSRRMGTGTYTLSVSATKVGYLEGSATRTFIVQ
jgi:subtilisin family serine protease